MTGLGLIYGLLTILFMLPVIVVEAAQISAKPPLPVDWAFMLGCTLLALLFAMLGGYEIGKGNK